MLQKKPITLRNSKGFGIIEVIIAVGILSIVATGTLGLIEASLRSNKSVATDTLRNSLHNVIKSKVSYQDLCTNSIIKNFNLKNVNSSQNIPLEFKISDSTTVKQGATLDEYNTYIDGFYVQNIALAATSNVTNESFFIGEVFIKEKALANGSNIKVDKKIQSLGAIHLVSDSSGLITKCSGSAFFVQNNTNSNSNTNTNANSNTNTNSNTNANTNTNTNSNTNTNTNTNTNSNNNTNTIANTDSNGAPVTTSSTPCQDNSVECIVTNYAARNNVSETAKNELLATPDIADRVNDYSIITNGANQIHGSSNQAYQGNAMVDNYISSNISAGRTDIGRIMNGVATAATDVGVTQVSTFIDQNPNTWEQAATIVAVNGGLNGTLPQADLGSIYDAVKANGITQEQVRDFFNNGGTMEQALALARQNGY